jgi:metal-responsive CopG/Arc/MetJ family transcriptional regulator
MKNPSKAIVTVQMPPELLRELEVLAAERGENLSVTVRDLVRQAALDARRGESPLSPTSPRTFR